MEFKDVCQISSGNSIKSSVKEDRYTGLDDGIPYIATKDISFSGEIDYANGVKIPFKEKANFRIAKSGSTLICAEGGSAGKKVALLNKDVCFVNKLFSLESNNGLNNKWVFYWCNSENFQAQFNSKLRGLIGGVSKGRFNSITIPVPPLTEQKRIVAILDEAFDAIDQAKANIERNIENAEELFQSKLNAVFSERGEGWEERRLGDLSVVKSGGTPRRSEKKYWEGGTIPWYSSGELNNLYTQQPERFITRVGLQKSNAKLFPKGSLLIGMYDTAALKMSILDRDGAFNQAISGVEPKSNLNLQFVMLSINANKRFLLKQRRGVRQKNLNLSKIKAISVPFPKVEIQNEIVGQLFDLKGLTDESKDSYLNKLIYLDDLKKSLLQKAFSGELTAKESVA